MPDDATYTQLIGLLDGGRARYRLIEHAAEGRTEVVSLLRRNPLAQAAKCMIVRVRVSKKERCYLLAVVPGDRRVDVDRLKGLFGGVHAGLAPKDVAERLAGSVSGSIVPFAFHAELQLVMDESLLDHENLYFNAGRLDRSVALDTADYLALAQPRVERIAGPAVDE